MQVFDAAAKDYAKLGDEHFPGGMVVPDGKGGHEILTGAALALWKKQNDWEDD